MSRKIAKLENDYTQQKATEKMAQNKMTHIKRVHKRRLLILSAIGVFVLVVFGMQILQTHRSLAEIKHATTVKEKKLKKAKSTEADLKVQVNQLHNQDYLAKYIRYKYYYSKDGETIFSLPQDKAPNLNQQQK